MKETDNAITIKSTGTEKLNSREIYSLLVYTHPFTSTCQKYFNKLFTTDNLDWKLIFLLVLLETFDSYYRSFLKS